LHRVTESFYEALKAAADELIGCVNDDEFEGHPTGCVLFEGMSDEQTVTADDTKPHQVDLRFNVRIVRNEEGGDPLGWNWFFDEGQGFGEWREMRTAGDKPIFKPGDFTQLYT
jgi:hypothetical protein